METSGTQVALPVLFVVLALSAGCSALQFATRRPARLRILLALKLVLLESYLTVSIPGVGIELALLIPFLLEVANTEGFPLNLALTGATLALFFGIRWANLHFLAGRQTAEWISDAGYILLVGLFGVLSCALVYYRNHSSTLEGRLQAFSQVVSRLTASNLSFQTLAKDAGEASKINERLRITRELHDIIGYTFTSNIMMMEAAISILHKDPQKVAQLIDQSRDNTQTGLEKIRSSLYHLRSMEGHSVSAQAQILKMTRTFGLATGVSIKVDFNNFPELMPGKSAEFFFCFIQQSITNAFLHGQANQIRVSLYQSGDGLFGTVKDNGKGGPVTIRDGIGISGMKERLAELNGTLRIWNTEKGFEVSSRVPVLPEEGSLGQ